MRVVTSASVRWLLCTFGLGVAMSACDNTPPETPQNTWTVVYANMKSACTPCHSTGGAQAVNFKIDLTNSATTYTNVQPLLNKSAPDQSKLIVVGKGGMYTPSGGGAQVAHSVNLRDPMLSNWVSWITAGAPQ